jgi:ankyrin repeat protein
MNFVTDSVSIVIEFQYNDTALMAAVSNNQPDIVLMLLRYDAVVDHQNGDGDSGILFVTFFEFISTTFDDIM